MIIVKLHWVQHPALKLHCQHLSNLRAKSLIEDVNERMVILPMFGWVNLGDAVGRKSLPTAGGQLAEGQERYLMPVRLKYRGNQWVPLNSIGNDIAFTAVGPGDFRIEGSFRLDTSSICGQQTLLQNQPVIIEPSVIVSSTIQRSSIVEKADISYWALLSQMEQKLRQELEREHERVRAEIYASTRQWHDQWISAEELDDLVSRLVHDPTQPLARTFEAQIHDEDIFDKVDPVRHLVTKIRQVSDKKIYDAIGDPSDGRGAKIRQAARTLQCKDLDLLPQLMVDHGLSQVKHHNSSVVAALHPVPRTTVSLDRHNWHSTARGEGDV